MTMTKTVSQSPRTCAYLLSEANGSRGREEITLATGAGKLVAGTVLAQLTAPPGKWVAYDPAGADDGRRTAAGILYAAADATAGDVKALAHVADCEVREEELTRLDPEAVADLNARQIAVRSN